MIHVLGMGSERNGRPKQILCYRAGDETGRLDLEKQEMCGLLVTLIGAALRLAGDT